MTVGTRHRPALGPVLPAFVLTSLIALLTLACFPVFANAEDSSGVQYSDSIPKPEGDNAPTHHRQTPANSSSTDKNGGAPAPNGTDSKDTTEGSGGDESSEAGGAPAKGDGGGTDQGSPGTSAKHPNEGGVQPGAQAPGTVTTQQSDDGGSSPLIPILIAVLVLAAISLGVVWFRQRRGSDPSAPPAASQKAS